MVDCHIHMVLDGVNWKDAIARHKAAPQEALIRQTLGHYQALGFSYLRDGGDRWGVCDLAAKLAPEYGIRYRSPGFPIYKTGHYGGFIGRGFDGLAEYRALVREAKTRGAHFIKLMISGLMDFSQYGVLTGEPLPPDLIRDMIACAHDEGFSVMAHANGDEAVRAALAGGVDSIEHGAQPSDEMITLFKQRKAFQISTISPALPYALFDRSISHATYEQQENGKIVFDGIVALAKANLAAGVPVGLGTDVGCPYITHYDMWRELHYFVKYCGVTPAFALYSATKLNARLAGIGDLTGSIEADKQADLIVCSGNPLQNLSALRELDMVVKGGYRIDKPQIKKMDEIERELDKFL